MGEHADDLIEQQIRSTGQRMAREHMRELNRQSAADRKAAGLEECARNLAIHDAREAELAGVLEAGRDNAVLVEAKLELRRVGKAVHALRAGTTSIAGIWKPGKKPLVGGHAHNAATPAAWLAALAAREHRILLGSDREAVHRAR